MKTGEKEVSVLRLGTIRALFMGLILIISLAPLGVSQDSVSLSDQEQFETDLDNVEAGSINGLDRALDRLRLRLSGDDPAVGLRIAAERIAEIKKLQEENRLDEAEKLAQEHERILERIRERADSDDDLEDHAKRRIGILILEKKISSLEEKLESEDLSEEEKAELESLLELLKSQLEDTSTDLESAEENALKRIAQERGLSLSDLREEFNDKFRQRIDVKAEQFSDESFTLAKVDYRFEYRGEGNSDNLKERLTNNLLEQIHMTPEEVDRRLKMESFDDDSFEHDEAHRFSDDHNERMKFRIDVREKEGEVRAKVDFKFRTKIESLEREEIVSQLSRELNAITKEDLVNMVDFKIGDDSKTDSDRVRNKIEVEIEGNIADVEVEWNDRKLEFKLEHTDKESLLREIASRLEVSVEEVRKALVKFEVEHEDHDNDDDDDSEDDDSGRDSDDN